MNTRFAYTFWKDNEVSGEYTVTIEDLKERFTTWMHSKENSWLKYYCGVLVEFFVMESDGLSAVIGNEEMGQLISDLKETKWQYLNSVGIR